uniref:Frizzled-3 n=1 Tax=Hofstenia miamia TaxID=442651 RepID=A0A068CMC4_HOFMI|nr:frizzled-3 [Hofstenia miamia]
MHLISTYIAFVLLWPTGKSGRVEDMDKLKVNYPKHFNFLIPWDYTQLMIERASLIPCNLTNGAELYCEQNMNMLYGQNKVYHPYAIGTLRAYSKKTNTLYCHSEYPPCYSFFTHYKRPCKWTCIKAKEEVESESFPKYLIINMTFPYFCDDFPDFDCIEPDYVNLLRIAAKMPSLKLNFSKSAEQPFERNKYNCTRDRAPAKICMQLGFTELPESENPLFLREDFELFKTYINLDCSIHMKYFICSAFAYSCDENGYVRGDQLCRDIIYQAIDACKLPVQMKGIFPSQAFFSKAPYRKFNTTNCYRPTIPPAIGSTKESLTIDQCKNLGYTEVAFPNHFFQPNQSSAFTKMTELAVEDEEIWSSQLLVYMCHIFFPPIFPGDDNYKKPCREYCNYMAENYKLPFFVESNIDCSTFPVANSNLPCIQGPSEEGYYQNS